MRHNNKTNSLGRTASHRSAMLSNMACSLIEHKRINTTVAKAKALRRYVEPILTKGKTDSTHSRRVVFSILQNKEAVTELFRSVAPKIGDRPGGYTRIIKTGFRQGDGAEMAMIELVDFNELYGAEEKKKTRRSRRGGKKTTDTPKVEASPKAEATAETTEEVKAEVVETVEEVKEAAAEVVEEVKEAATEVAEEVKEVAAEVEKKVEDAATPEPEAEAKPEEGKEEDKKDSKE